MGNRAKEQLLQETDPGKPPPSLQSKNAGKKKKKRVSSLSSPVDEDKVENTKKKRTKRGKEVPQNSQVEDTEEEQVGRTKKPKLSKLKEEVKEQMSLEKNGVTKKKKGKAKKTEEDQIQIGKKKKKSKSEKAGGRGSKEETVVKPSGKTKSKGGTRKDVAGKSEVDTAKGLTSSGAKKSGKGEEYTVENDGNADIQIADESVILPDSKRKIKTQKVKKRKALKDTEEANEVGTKKKKKKRRMESDIAVDVDQKAGGDNVENTQKPEAATGEEDPAQVSEKHVKIDIDENLNQLRETPQSLPSGARAFRRVQAEDWVGKKGSWDNSYGATFGNQGWGAKAQEVLGKVRGKDFKHEKTKKKRGSYRGGVINSNAVNSIKFDD